MSLKFARILIASIAYKQSNPQVFGIGRFSI